LIAYILFTLTKIMTTLIVYYLRQQNRTAMKLIHSIFKVADIQSAHLSQELKDFLSKDMWTYADVRIGEDIYDLEDIIDTQENSIDVKHIASKFVLKELKKIQKSLTSKECSYLRIVNL
jgi:hypothetical protein